MFYYQCFSILSYVNLDCLHSHVSFLYKRQHLTVLYNKITPTYLQKNTKSGVIKHYNLIVELP